MINNSVSLNIFIVFLFAGLIVGFIYNFLGLIKIATKRNFLVENIVDFLCAVMGGFVFIYCVFRFQEGYFSLFEVVGFAIGIVFARIIVKNLFTSLIKWVYNKVKSRRTLKNFKIN